MTRIGLVLGAGGVIVSSPMSHTGPWLALGFDTLERAISRAALRREERRLRAAGTRVIVRQPGHRVRTAMRLNPKQPEHRERTAECTDTAIRAWLARSAPGALLDDASLAGTA